ncbi:MAG: ROK family protein [Oscillospiraceae bacterium]|nr:ROK family protein [Oscillospiraceae bacterium]
MKYYIGIDLGGTNTVAGIVDESMQIIAKSKMKTRIPRPAAEICRDIAELCLELTGMHNISMSDITWLGIGSPGVVWENVVCYASNLEFVNAPIAALLEEQLHRPVYAENDANAAAYAEYIAGAGRGCTSMAAITIGTGIGSGIIFGNSIHTGFNGAAAELGHTIVEYGGLSCACGKRGCLEMYCSATGLIRMTVEAMNACPDSLMWSICGEAGRPDGRTAFEAMKRGDASGGKVVDKFIGYLAAGVSNVINLFQPQLVCIGGGVSGEGDALLLPLREKVSRMVFSGKNAETTQIKIAELGNDAGVIGAAMLGKAEH